MVFFDFKKWAINNGWTKGLTLDRVDNDKGYYPKNCRFATRIEQNYHRRSNILYEYFGMEMPLGMIAKIEDVKYDSLYNRVKQKGMTVRQALENIKKCGS